MWTKINRLSEFDYWVGKSAQVILDEVRAVGGWRMVFPPYKEFPVWASRLRNFFNEEPLKLRLYDKIHSNMAKKKAQIRWGNVEEDFALHGGRVYEDERSRLWFEMSTAGAIYHVRKNQLGRIQRHLPDKGKAITETLSRKKNFPIFKLICPDKTGGSMETIIFNRRRSNTIADLDDGQTAMVRGLIETHSKYKGSYNYSDTIKDGFAAHDLRDIKPDKVSKDVNFFIRVPNYFGSTLSGRVFLKEHYRN